MEANEKLLFNEVTLEESAVINGGDSAADDTAEYTLELYNTPTNPSPAKTSPVIPTVSLFPVPSSISNGIVPNTSPGSIPKLPSQP